ncbi:MAG: CAP domain-containing protein, partial [Oscillospiraceae bacterium]
LKVTGADDAVWSSSDSSVAAVKSSDGTSAKIVGKKTGTAYIYAKVGSKKLKCKVTVRQSFITASNDSLTLEKGKSQTITLTVKGSKTIALSNSDKSVCTTSWGKWNDNKIKLTINAKKAGTATIKVYAKGYSKTTVETITVKVKNSSASGSGTGIIIFGSDGSVYIVEDDGSYTGTDSSGSSSDNSGNTGDSSSVTEKVIELVNEERSAAGKSTLASDPVLNEVAALRAREIAESFSHTRPDGTSCFTAFNDAGIVNVYMGENIAAGQRTPEEVMNSWMNSSGHKANILSGDYERIGVGFCQVSGGYGYYWVQVFASY